MTTLADIASNQGQKEIIANANFKAVSPAGLFANRYGTTAGLTWGYYGGMFLADGVLTSIADGTLLLAASNTNFIEATRAGVVSSNTTGFTVGRIPLYSAVTGASSITSYADYRLTNQPIFGSKTKSVAGGVDVTLTQADAACNHFIFTGVISANINVNFPAVPKAYSIFNNTTGAFAINFKATGGTGVYIQQGQRAYVICDGTNIYFLSSVSRRLKTVAYAGTINLDWSDADSIFITLAGSPTINLNNAVPGQSCLLTLLQDATGSRTVTWGSNVRYGTDIASITLSTNANYNDKIGFIFNDDGASKYDVVSIVRGYH
jgi:hypothetical protein